MRLLYIVFFVSCLAIVVYLAFSESSRTKPEPVAMAFLRAIRINDVGQAVAFFGDNTCACPPKGGYISYLQYQSAQTPNLAFLLGQALTIARPVVEPIAENVPYVLPWERPQAVSVSLPLMFSTVSQRPYYLPLPTAFGQPLPYSQLKQYMANPAADHGKGFSLRLRPTVSHGFITARAPACAYQSPADPGPITSPSGQVLTDKELAAKLPRLASVVLHLKMVRRGLLHPWQVAHFHFTDGIVQQPDGQLVKLNNGHGS